MQISGYATARGRAFTSCICVEWCEYVSSLLAVVFINFKQLRTTDIPTAEEVFAETTFLKHAYCLARKAVGLRNVSSASISRIHIVHLCSVMRVRFLF